MCYDLYLSSVFGVELQGLISLSTGPSWLQHHGQLLVMTRQLYEGHTVNKQKNNTWITFLHERSDSFILFIHNYTILCVILCSWAICKTCCRDEQHTW